MINVYQGILCSQNCVLKPSSEFGMLSLNVITSVVQTIVKVIFIFGDTLNQFESHASNIGVKHNATYHRCAGFLGMSVLLEVVRGIVMYSDVHLEK